MNVASTTGQAVNKNKMCLASPPVPGGLRADFYDDASVGLHPSGGRDAAAALAAAAMSGGDPTAAAAAAVASADAARGLSNSRVDAHVNFTWGGGRISPTGSDFVTVRYWGKLRAVASEQYTLIVRADDNARLWLDGVLVLDAWEVRRM